MFEWTFYGLLVEKFKIPLTPTPKQCKTHDFEISYEIGIEAKGSPAYIVNPNGSRYELVIRGLLRSDTEKKAFANAKEFKKKYPDRYFYIVTNAMPDRLVGYKNRDVNGVYDVTKEKQLGELIKELRSKKTQRPSRLSKS